MKVKIYPLGTALLLLLALLSAGRLTAQSKAEVWDFGAEVLDTEVYDNQLSVATINDWYDTGITPGSNGNVLPSAWTAGRVSWTGGGNDRLRSTNTELTRYDENISNSDGYTGRLYVNSGANTTRYLSLQLNEDDEITLVVKTDAGGNLVFTHEEQPEVHTEERALTSDVTTLEFVARAAGTYRVYDNQGKPSYFRIIRKAARYITVSGSIDRTAATDLPASYALSFTNEAGKSWTTTVSDDAYSLALPAGYAYTVALKDTPGFILESGETLAASDTDFNHNLAVSSIELVSVSGALEGLAAGDLIESLVFSPAPNEGSGFIPQALVDVDNNSYSVELEPACTYTVHATGINDYFLSTSTILVNEATTQNLVFTKKTVHPVTITTTGLPEEAVTGLQLIFSNLNEEGYNYSFSGTDGISLRNGTYEIQVGGLDNQPLQLAPTSYLQVNDEAAEKNLEFRPLTTWSFDDMTITASTANYKGLLLQGTLANEIAKGHLAAKPGASIQVPVDPGQKLVVGYYYAADFSIEGGPAITTASGSTSQHESAEYLYQGSTAGTVTLTIGEGAGTTYLTSISLRPAVAYSATLEVGSNKTYPSISEALEAVRNMNRTADQRVTLLIDPGNYEEMLVVDVPSVTLKNAGSNPSIQLANSGVDIEDGAVRITSYYGHGYSYFSMASNQKWDADVLRVNKENNALSYENKGAGTTNGSYWNATVVVTADGFEAENIIFENSFNQYISQKEANDVVVPWISGSKGDRPTDYGNTAVQDKSFVERAAALAIAKGADKVVLNNCRLVGHQDTFFGGSGARVAVYKGAIMGGTDYIFGDMNATFYRSDLVLNTSDASSDVAYITAAQQSGGRGYLMYQCNIVSAVPGRDNASAQPSKPGYFGRPWQANTSEVVFFETQIAASEHPDFSGQSLIYPVGWMSTLGGESPYMYEYATQEAAGVDNQASRASWSTLLEAPRLSDDTEITLLNFTKGSDGWDPLSALIADETTGLLSPKAELDVDLTVLGETLHVNGVQTPLQIQVYNLQGSLQARYFVSGNAVLSLSKGFWIIRATAGTQQKIMKVWIP